MGLNSKICSLLIFTPVFLLSNQVIAKPPFKPGNPGVPGLLAEIEALETQLAQTKDDLAQAGFDLATTEAVLTNTEVKLENTRASLVETQANLLTTEALLSDTFIELEQEKQTYRVPRTGQDQCWDSDSLEPNAPHYVATQCLTGQDGEKQAGLAPPSGRFVDNQDGTILDTFTNLVWLKDAGCLVDLTWEEALSRASRLPERTGSGDIVGPWICNLNDGTAGQWRLPNVQELMSLLNYRSAYNTLPSGHPFTDFDGFYWTSTTYALDPNFPVDDFLYTCEREGYGHNRRRFNDAYIVSVSTGEVIHAPKAIPGEILLRHGEENYDSLPCHSIGFTSGSPDDSPNYLPHPGFIAVREFTE